MKTLITLLLLTAVATAQTFTFYAGTSKSFGAEIMLNETAGFGFAGTNEPTNDIGIKIGYDTFNEIKIGVNVYF